MISRQDEVNHLIFFYASSPFKGASHRVRVGEYSNFDRMEGKVLEKHLFANAYTSQGIVCLTADLYQGLDGLYLLAQEPEIGQDELLEWLYREGKSRGEMMWVLHSPLQVSRIVGLVLPARSLGVIAAEALPQGEGCMIAVSACFDAGKLQAYAEQIAWAKLEREAREQAALHAFREARQLHHQREQIYVRGMDFPKADQVATALIENLFGKEEKGEREGQSYRLFFGAATPAGAHHFIEENTAQMSRRYILHGRAGCGKSTLLKRIGKEGEERGFIVEYYHCSFDPASIDMVILPQLQVAILDGTSPHAIQPHRPGDEVIDLFHCCVDPEIEVEEGGRLSILQRQYKEKIEEGTAALRAAQAAWFKQREWEKEAVRARERTAWLHHWQQELLQFLT